jgi:protein gp37
VLRFIAVEGAGGAEEKAERGSLRFLGLGGIFRRKSGKVDRSQNQKRFDRTKQRILSYGRSFSFDRWDIRNKVRYDRDYSCFCALV